MKKYARYVSIAIVSLLFLIISLFISIFIWIAIWGEETITMAKKEDEWGWSHILELLESFFGNVLR